MAGQLIKEGYNWLIIDFIGHEKLELAKKACDEVYKYDYSHSTSAQGPMSTQNYFISPHWLPRDEFVEAASWPELRDLWTKIVQSEVVHHNFMPFKWTNLKAHAAWTVSGGKGSFHTAHDHGGSAISSVTYLDVPEDPNYEYPTGNIFFVLHGDPYNELSPPGHRVFTLKPQPGMIVIFPSWMVHGVYPQGEGLRRTLNIDFEGYFDESLGILPGQTYSQGSVTFGS